MEMQRLEFHSVNRSGSAASSNDEHLDSSSSISPSSSSDLSSPDLSHSSVPSPPATIHSPPAAHISLQLQADQHYSISIPSVEQPASLHYPTKEEALTSLRESIPHSMRLTQLQKSEREYQKEASWNKKLVRRASKDLYNIVSIYALLQGVLFAAVAQSSIFSCEDWWGPASIVVAVTLGAVIAALDKLRYMGYQQQEVKKFERRQSAVYDKIELLYCRGSSCQIESLEPAHNDCFTDEPGTLCIFSAHGLLVLGFLLGFSALMLVSCMRMLACNQCRCNQI